jgi:hypothetical protein
MSELREPAIMVVVGCKGVGKTHKTREEVKYQAEYNKRKTIVYDPSLDPELKYKTISIEHVSKFFDKSYKIAEIRRVLGVDKYGKELTTDGKKELLKQLLEVSKNGILWLEDFNKYITNERDIQELIGLMTTNRHKNLDIIFHYQSLKAVYTRMFQNTRIFRLHKDLESVDTFADRLADKYEMFKLAQLIIDAEYRKGTPEGKRFFLYVLTDDFKIIGATLKQFQNACTKYLYANRTLLKRVKDENNLKSEQEAIAFFVKDRASLYLPKS